MLGWPPALPDPCRPTQLALASACRGKNPEPVGAAACPWSWPRVRTQPAALGPGWLASSCFPSDMAKAFESSPSGWENQENGASTVCWHGPLGRAVGPLCALPLVLGQEAWRPRHCRRRSFSFVTHVTLASASSYVMRLQPGRGRWDLDCGHVPYWLLVLINRALLPAPPVAWGPAMKDGLGFRVGQHTRAVLCSLRPS